MTRRTDREKRFSDSLPEAVRRFVETIDFIDWRPTGSRLFCPDSARVDSDWDFLIRESDAWAEMMIQNGWEGTGGSPTGETGTSLKRNMDGHIVNLIQIPPGGHYDSFHWATLLCSAIGGPTEKAQRIQVFERCKAEGWSLDTLRPDDQWSEWPNESFDLLVAADEWEQCGGFAKAEFLRNPSAKRSEVAA